MARTLLSTCLVSSVLLPALPSEAAELAAQGAQLRVSVFPRIGLFDPTYFRSTYSKVERAGVRSINFLPVRPSDWRPWSEAEYVSALREQLQREFRGLGAWELMTSEYLHENGGPGQTFEPYRRRQFHVTFVPRPGEKATSCVLRMTPPSGQTLVNEPDPDCRLNYRYSIDTNAEVRLELQYQSDKHGPSLATATIPEDFLIVSLGDSFASGEGNPDVSLTHMGELPTGLTPPAGTHVPVWMDIRCHRSAWAGAVRAGLQIAAERKAVTILSLACSGAQVETGIRTRSEGVRPIEEYLKDLLPSGVSAPAQGALTRDVLGQMEVLRKFLDGQADGSDAKRSIDAFVLSSGGNDVRFGDIVTDIVTKSTSPTDRETLRRSVEADLSRLAAEVYLRLAQDLAGFRIGDSKGPNTSRQIRQLLVTEYPDPTRRVAKPTRPEDFCDGSADSILGIPVATLTREEAKWAFENVVQKLRPIVNAHARELGALAVTGITDAYVGRGWCAAGADSDPYADSTRWMRTHKNSQKFQGSKHGTLHPTWQGQQHYATRIRAEIERSLAEQVAPVLALGKGRQIADRFVPAPIDIVPHINGKPEPGRHPWCIASSPRDGCDPAAEPEPLNYLHGQTASLHVRVTHRDTRRIWSRHLGTFTVDAKPPVLRQCVMGTSECGRAFWTRTGDGFHVALDDEDGSGVAWTKALLERVDDESPEGKVLLQASPSAPGRISSTALLPDGEWSVTVSAADRVGNESPNLSPKTTVLVDNAPPKVVDLRLAGADHLDLALQNGTPVLEGYPLQIVSQIRDEHSGARRIELRLGAPGAPMNVENEKATGGDSCPKNVAKEFGALFTHTPFSPADAAPSVDLGITAHDCVGNTHPSTRLRIVRVKPSSQKPMSAAAWRTRTAADDADWRAGNSISPRFSGARPPDTDPAWGVLAAYLNLAHGRARVDSKASRTLNASCQWADREGTVWGLLAKFESCAPRIQPADLAAWWSAMDDALVSSGILSRADGN